MLRCFMPYLGFRDGDGGTCITHCDYAWQFGFGFNLGNLSHTIEHWSKRMVKTLLT